MRQALFVLALTGCAVDTDMTDVEQGVMQPRVLLPVSGTGQQAVVITGEYAPLDVALFELDGTPVPGATITFTAPAGAARFLEDGVTETDGEGRASMRPYPSSVAGEYTAWAHADGADPMPFLLTNHPGPAAQLEITSGTNQLAAFGQQFASPLAVTVRDLYGNAVPDAVVEFAPPTDGASARMVDHGETVTDKTGHASTYAVAGPIAGSYYVFARVAGAGHQRFLLANTAPRRWLLDGATHAVSAHALVY